MKLKKMAAVALTATMVLGNSVAVFAGDTDPANSATGTGTSYDHLNKDVITVTLPTEAQVTGAFNYVVDPEGLVKAAGKLADNTAVTGNDDGVYFNTGSAYASTSKDVEFEGKNSVAVDVTVAVTYTSDDKDIALVADDAALTAATTPSLLMTLNVGSNSTAITASGASASATIAGVPDNFEVTVDNGAYKYAPKSNATGWNKIAINLSGKTNNVAVPDGTGAMTAPNFTLTWTVAKHVDRYVSANTLSSTSNSLTLTVPEGVTVTKVTCKAAGASTANDLPAARYTVSGTTITFVPATVTAFSGGEFVIVFSDDHTETIAIQ